MLAPSFLAQPSTGTAMVVKGPATLAEALDLGREVRRSVEGLGSSYAPGALQRLTGALGGGVVVTTSYSGLGSAEVAVGMLAREFRSAQGAAPGLCYSACDCANGPRKVLLAHAEAAEHTGPHHVFSNVMDRVPSGPRQELEKLVNTELQVWKAFKRKWGPWSSQARRTKKKMSTRLLQRMIAMLERVEFNNMLPCRVHGQLCPANIRLVPGFEEVTWVEIAGSVCKPWSSMGAGDDWLDPTSLPCLVWAYSTKYYEPDIILHECVPSFDYRQLDRILSGRRNACRAPPRNPFGRLSLQEQSSWRMRSEILSPHDFGVPTRRRRRYTYFWRGEHFTIDVGKDAPNGIRDMFQKERELNASVYLVQRSSETRSVSRRMLEQRKLSCDVPDDALPCQADCLHPVWRIHMIGFQELAQQKGINLVDPMAAPEVAIVNLVQRPHFSKLIDTDLAPTLLTGSILFDLVRERRIGLPECGLMQGLPFACRELPVELTEHVEHIRFLILSGALSDSQVRTLLGNMMHVSVVGSAIAYLLCAVRRL